MPTHQLHAGSELRAAPFSYGVPRFSFRGGGGLHYALLPRVVPTPILALHHYDGHRTTKDNTLRSCHNFMANLTIMSKLRTLFGTCFLSVCEWRPAKIRPPSGHSPPRQRHWWPCVTTDCNTVPAWLSAILWWRVEVVLLQ